ncbi:MAG: DUF1178 family protein [Rhizobiaceae bacterium]|nr:DUF1178 family protein [Rhizobiaceae bacterium]
MIKYALICDQAHEFEAWFGSSDDYDKQRKRGFVDCPVCGSNKVEKMLMAPGVSGTKKTGSADVPMTTMPQMPAEMVEKLREIKQHVEANSENVGDKFPEEARKIHYGESEARGIYGKASVEEAASLVEEGVGVMPIPELPEDKN